MVQYSFTSTETKGSLGRTAQDGHLDSHTAPELCNDLKRDIAAIVRTQPELTAQKLDEELRTLLDKHAPATRRSAGRPVLSVVCQCQQGPTVCQTSAPPGWAEVAQIK